MKLTNLKSTTEKDLKTFEVRKDDVIFDNINLEQIDLIFDDFIDKKHKKNLSESTRDYLGQRLKSRDYFKS